MEIASIRYIGDLRTEAKHLKSGQIVITDAPVDNKGKGEAFSPTDLMSSALGSCMLTIMGIAAQTHNLNIDGTELKITKLMKANPRCVGEIKIEFTMPKNNYTLKEKEIIEKAAKTCPVALSLGQELKQTVIFNY
ncbi:MAG: OsmC family protein [Bacteroidetes bacterium]|nr:OsmC family protein [Bacteroidota bacterium]